MRGGIYFFFGNAAFLNNCGMEETRKQLTFFPPYLPLTLPCLSSTYLLPPPLHSLCHLCRQTASSGDLVTFRPCCDSGSRLGRSLTTEPWVRPQSTCWRFEADEVALRQVILRRRTLRRCNWKAVSEAVDMLRFFKSCVVNAINVIVTQRCLNIYI
jgi:hypothetical protein